jgi:hypothetical protein
MMRYGSTDRDLGWIAQHLSELRNCHDLMLDFGTGSSLGSFASI